jgi:penicillin-binding protein 2
MFSKRIKIFIAFCIALAILCLVRLMQMQILDVSDYRDKVDKLKLQGSRSRQLNTVRGQILDRKGRVLATDEPKFQIHINYQITCYLDDRVKLAKMITASKAKDPETATKRAEKLIDQKLDSLNRIIDKCTYFGLEREIILENIQGINDKIWHRRIAHAWRNKCSDSEFYQKNKDDLLSPKISLITEDFEKHFPDRDKQLVEIIKSNIAEMHWNYSLLELNTDEKVFKALYEFMDVSDVTISPEGYRVYPYGSIASQVIGWVGPEQKGKLFANDELLKYLPGVVWGRSPGVEYVCEAILRGRRGKLVYDIDRNLVNRTNTRLGRDVKLTLDIELQKKVNDYLINYPHATHCKGRMAAVVIDIHSAEILTLVSIPTFDLNRIRTDYGNFNKDPNKPLINRAIYATYPPGSVIKPIIAVIGLETGNINPNDVISCPAAKPPKSWPRCWIQKRHSWLGHDDQWADGPGNIARNAIRGSCNIYFSRLANRIDSDKLQKWLFAFGYGRSILPPPAEIKHTENERNLKQSSGLISSRNPPWGTSITSLEQLKDLPIKSRDKRWFGIGQGNCRVTPLQVANTMAIIARGGIYKNPRLYIEDPNFPSEDDSIDLGIRKRTLDIVRDGLSAVVNETNGTANQTFRDYLSKFAEMGVKIYGKTGSTEAPENAWFAGFAEDNTGRAVAIAVVVEGGQSGSQDASPLGRDIINFCIEEGYIGKIPELEADK